MERGGVIDPIEPNESSRGAPRVTTHIAPDSFAGKVVLVTGGSSGIGRAIALEAAAAGADVALTFRANERGAREVVAAVAALGRRAEVLRLDIAHPEEIEAAGRWVRERYGVVDAWINNAGADILTAGGAALSDREKLDLLLTVDLRGSILASWEAAAIMRAQPSGGVIVNMSWDHVIAGMEGRNPQMYSAVKGGVQAFSKSLARSVAPRVRVNVVAPGWIETAFGAGLDPDRYEWVAEGTPLRRWGRPEDVAHAAVWLASPGAAFLTGQVVMVNGGIVM
jgi:3-oxoacyl-[acyl-carrier protein] reductase